MGGASRRPSGAARALARLLLVALLGGLLVLVAPAAPASAATTASLTIEPNVTTTTTGSTIFYTAGFEVSGGTLQNAQVRLFFPKSQFRQVFATGGGISQTVSQTATGTIITYFLGKLTDGTIGTVSAQGASLLYVPDGSQATVTGDISGLGLAPQAAPPATVDLTAAIGPKLAVRGNPAVASPGPGALSGQPGYNVTFPVQAASDCGSFGPGCLPFDGRITETLPPESYFVSLANPPEYVDRATGAPDGPGFTFPADTPLGTNLSGAPAPGTGPGGTIDVDVYLHPLSSRMLSDGRYVQSDSWHDDLPQTPTTLTDRQFLGTEFQYTPPILLLTVWVPQSSIPANGLTVTNSVRMQGGGFDGTVTASVPIGVPDPGPGGEFPTLVKDYRAGFATDCRGYGTSSTAAWDPATGVGNQVCVVREGNSAGANKYVVGVFTNGGRITSPRVTDVLPDELDYAGTSLNASGWWIRFSDDPACSSTTPDSAFVDTQPAKVECVRYGHDGVWLGTVAFWETFVNVDTDVYSPGPGEFRRVTNTVTLRGPTLASPLVWSQDVAIVDRWDVSSVFGGNVSGVPGSVVNTFAFASSVGGGGSAGPPDFTLQVDLPADLSVIEATPTPVADVDGNPLPTTCEVVEPAHRLVCEAQGEGWFAASHSVQIVARISPDATPGFQPIWTCAYAQLPPGAPLNPAGQSPQWGAHSTPDVACNSAPHARTAGSNLEVLDPDPPPDPRTGNPLVDLDKTRESPLGEPIDAGEEVTYSLDYRHLDTSDGDLHGAYVYDFLGRHPVSGALLGDVRPEFVSAQTTYPDGAPETLAYTCTADPTIATATWSASPCGTVTGVRWQLNSTVAPDDPPGSYRVTDPPGHVLITVRVPDDAQVGDELVNVGGIDADAIPPAAGQRVTNVVGGDTPVAEDAEVTVNVPGARTIRPDRTDPDGDLVNELEVVSVDHGTAFWDDDRNGIRYESDPSFGGSEAFVVYRACDVTGRCDEGTITIHLNHAPVTGADEATALAGGVVTINTYANDTDPEGEDLPADGSWSFDTFFTHGVAEEDAGGPSGGPGVIRYYAPTGFTGVDTATYVLCDSEGACSEPTTITVTVADGDPHPPMAVDDQAALPSPEPITIDVAGNDLDPDADLDRSSVRITTFPTNGTVEPLGDGSVSYAPAGDPMPDTFTYEICDVFGLCDEAVVTIFLVGPPVAVDDSVTVPPDEASEIDVLANDTDPDDDLDPTSVSIEIPPTQGSLEIDEVTGAITYTPDPGASGSDGFVYVVCDVTGLCDNALVAITYGHPPVAEDDPVIAVPGVDTTFDVLANDTDPDGNLDPASVEITEFPEQGIVEVGLDGVIGYSPDSDATGTDSFTYRVCDTTGLCDEATATITFHFPPDAVDDAYDVQPGGTLEVDVTDNDTDPDGDLDIRTVSITGDPGQGQASVDDGGIVHYVADPGATGTDTFTYQVCDVTDLCDEATVTVTFVHAPDAVDDTPLAVPGEDTVLDLTANDTDEDGDLDPSSVQVTTPATKGTTSVAPETGEVTYTADPGATGTDTFTYEVCDLTGLCDQATVTVTFHFRPVAEDDDVKPVPGQPLVIAVLDNDTDPDDDIDPSSVIVTTPPTKGTTSVNPDSGEITYTPDPGASGTDTFTYEVCDDTGLCDRATVTLTYFAPPIAVDDRIEPTPGAPVEFDVTSNDSDPDDDLDPTSVSIVDPPAKGTAEVDPATGFVTYTGTVGESGTDSFTYEVCDENGLCSMATVHVAFRFPPDAVDDTANATPGTPVVIDVTSNDSDPDGDLDVTTVEVTVDATKGTTSVNADTGAVTYTPALLATGADVFTYRICDATGRCDTAMVSVTLLTLPPQSPPDAADDSASVSPGNAVVVNVLANDSDPDGDLDPDSLQVAGSPSQGTAMVTGPGQVTYLAGTGAAGSDSFTYTVCDVGDRCDTATVTITIVETPPPPGSPPVANDDDAGTVDAGAAVVVDVLANDTDPDGDIDPASVIVTGGPGQGSAVVDTATGAITYTANITGSGGDSFTYQVCDGGGRCDSATVNVNINPAPPVAHPPVANDDTGTVAVGGSVVLNLAANDTDPDGDLVPGSLTVGTPPAQGTFTPDGNGGGTYVANVDAPLGDDTFTYTICDTGGRCDSATVTVTITEAPPPANPPSAADDSTSTNPGVAVTVNVAANDSDPDGDLVPTSVEITAGPNQGVATVNPDTGEITYTPDADADELDTLTYQICDGGGRCASARLTITIVPIEPDPHPPTPMDDSVSATPGVPVVINVAGNDTDPDGDLVVSSVEIVSGPGKGSATVNGDTGAVTYTATSGATGTDTFTYRICDSGGRCGQAVVTITLLPEPQPRPPVANPDEATVNLGAGVVIEVAANDSDPDGNLDPSTVSITSDLSFGSATVDSGGRITYTADPDGEPNVEEFDYRICDTTELCATGTVRVTILEPPPPVSPPEAADDSATVISGRSVRVDVLANDTDPDGDLDAGSVRVVHPPMKGSTTVNPSTGAIRFTADTPLLGNDQFTYEVCDETELCDTAVVRIRIDPAVHPPVARDDVATVRIGESIRIDVAGNDSDPDGDLDRSSVRVRRTPGQGRVVVGTGGGLTYTPDLDAVGARGGLRGAAPLPATDDAFTYRICDLAGHCDSAQVTVHLLAAQDPVDPDDPTDPVDPTDPDEPDDSTPEDDDEPDTDEPDTDDPDTDDPDEPTDTTPDEDEPELEIEGPIGVERWAVTPGDPLVIQGRTTCSGLTFTIDGGSSTAVPVNDGDFLLNVPTDGLDIGEHTGELTCDDGGEPVPVEFVVALQSDRNGQPSGNLLVVLLVFLLIAYLFLASAPTAPEKPT